jgi:NADH-ubiquinone oxidoreductase chain 2
MAFVGILTSVISASYYLRIVVLLFTESTEENLVKSTSSDVGLNSTPILTNFHSFLISTITLSILLFIFKPTLILNSTQLLALSYFNY